MTNSLGQLWRRLCRTGGASAVRDESDGELLRRYLELRDEAAFEALLRRHAGMVFGVCRRVLRDAGAAEDAFQATFLLLLRKAHSIRRLDALACWLHGVAYRVAVRAAVNERKRRQREREAAAMKVAAPASDADSWEVRSVLDAELNRLPEKYRAPLVLCYLEGKTNEEAARQLGWPSGTVKGRLARARELLRKCLARRGLAVGGAALAALLAEETAAAAPLGWVTATVGAAALWTRGKTAAGAFSTNAVALSEGVMRAMFLKRVITAVALLLAVVVGVGASAGAYRAWGGKPADTPAAPAPETRVEDVKFVTIAKEDFQGPKVPHQSVITTAREWQAAMPIYWLNGPPELPAVDFDKQMVLAVAMGTKPSSGYATEITRIERADKGLIVHYREKEPAPGEVVQTAITGPFHIVRTDKGGPVTFVKDRVAPKEGPLPPGAVERLGKPETQTAFASSTVAYSRDGKRIAWVTTAAEKARSTVTVHVWDTATRKEVSRCKFAEDTAMATAGVAFGPDGKTLALATYHEEGGPGKSTRFGRTQVRLFDVDKGKELPAFNGLRGDTSDEFRTLAFAPDGKTVVTNRAWTVEVWDVASGKIDRSFEYGSEDDGGGAAYAVLSPGGVFAFCLNNDPVRLWDVTTGKKIREIKDAGSPVALSADGKVLATTGPEQIRLWSVETGKELRAVKGEANETLLAAFSSDGKLLAWVGKDKTAHVAATATGEEVGTFKTDGGHVAFSPDGKTLASACADGTVLLWKVPGADK
jgi:RNA polymerase sigma factor (sigma-70 family)